MTGFSAKALKSSLFELPENPRDVDRIPPAFGMRDLKQLYSHV
jgi:hypothetical protein